MTRKRRRLAILILFLLGLGSATALTLTAFQDHLVLFYSPSDLAAGRAPGNRAIRIGGLVEPGTIERAGGEIRFTVTDNVNRLRVAYVGIVPDLFREGQGVIAQGRMDGPVFRANEVLARHDENYMPPEVADALRRAGHFREPAR